MAANPQSFFRFAARRYPLLRDLFYRGEGFSEADLRALIEGQRGEGDPGAATVIEQLLDFGIIEPIPDATAAFELTAPVSNLLSFLLREQRLTSARVIQGYLDDLEELHRERRTVRERFEIINRLWSRYLEPLRDLIDVKKAMDAGLEDLLRRYGKKKMLADSAAILARLRQTADPQVRQVVTLLDRWGVGLEQEALLLQSPASDHVF